MKNTILTLTSLVLMLTSCSPSAPHNNLLSSTPSITPTILPSFTRMAKIPTTDVPSPTPVVLSTAKPDATTKQCMDSQQELPQNVEGRFILSGNYVLYSPKLEQYNEPSYIWIPNTGEQVDLPEQSGSDFLVSSDGKLLAYYIKSGDLKGELIIVNSDGKLHKKYSVENWWKLLKWVNNERLLVAKLAQHNPYPVVVFNPFTGKSDVDILPNYPKIFSGLARELSTWGNFELSETSYNSDFSMVVYPKTPNSLVLWDIQAKKAITEINDRSASTHAPLWLTNGKGFIVDITTKNTAERWYQDELFNVNVDGSLAQLTNLSDLGYINVAIQQYSESTDGRYIAFWFAQVRSGPSRFAIYDLLTKKTKVYCSIVGGYTRPIWSPSVNQLLVDGTFDSLDHYGTIFIDIENDAVAQVKVGRIPVGWMLEPE